MLLLLAALPQPAGADQQGFLTLPFANPNIVITDGWFYADDGTHHGGIDYALPPAASFDVLAAADGKAVAVDSDLSGYGLFIYIAHIGRFDSLGSMYFTLYAHLERSSLPRAFPTRTVGEGGTLEADIAAGNFADWRPVSRGEKLGRAGQTGEASGIHLHFEVQRGGYPAEKTDPYDIYAQDLDLYPAPCVPQMVVANDPGLLWTQCPPVAPFTTFTQADASAITTVSTQHWIQTLGANLSETVDTIAIKLKFNGNSFNASIGVSICEDFGTGICFVYDARISMGSSEIVDGQLVTYAKPLRDVDSNIRPFTFIPGVSHIIQIDCLGEFGSCQVAGSPNASSYPDGALFLAVFDNGQRLSPALPVADAFFISASLRP